MSCRLLVIVKGCAVSDKLTFALYTIWLRSSLPFLKAFEAASKAA